MSTVPACPLCGDTRKMHKPKQLYGHDVCKKCVGKFANRRQFAYLIDLLIFYVLQIVGGAALGIMLVIIMQPTDEAFFESDAVTLMAWGVILFLALFYLWKDGFAGRSPGKMAMGVQVVDQETEEPIGFGTSFKRNIPLVIPFMPLVIAVTMMKGPRFGDNFAKTKVVWQKFANNPVFSKRAAALAAAQTGFGPERMQLPPTQQTGNPFQAPRQ